VPDEDPLREVAEALDLERRRANRAGRPRMAKVMAIGLASGVALSIGTMFLWGTRRPAASGGSYLLARLALSLGVGIIGFLAWRRVARGGIRLNPTWSASAEQRRAVRRSIRHGEPADSPELAELTLDAIAIQRRVWPWVPILYVVLASIVLLDLVTGHSSSPESDVIGVALFLGLALWQTVAVIRLKHAEVTNRDFLDRQ